MIQLCREPDSQVAAHVMHSPEAEGQDSAHEGMAQLVSRIRDDRHDIQAEALAELYQLFSRGIRFYMTRQLPPEELEDRVHDAFILVVKAIRNGELREPARLMGFVNTVVRRQVAAHIENAVRKRSKQVELDDGAWLRDPRSGPEEGLILKQQRDLIRCVLSEIPPRDKEILTRFYLHEQSQEQICAEMELSPTQFRLLKSRAKLRFGELGRRKAARYSLRSMKASARAAANLALAFDRACLS